MLLILNIIKGQMSEELISEDFARVLSGLAWPLFLPSKVYICNAMAHLNSQVACKKAIQRQEPSGPFLSKTRVGVGASMVTWTH